MKRILSVFALVLLVACSGGNKLDAGTVIDKSYDDPDTWFVPGVYIPGSPGSCTGGKTPVCTPGRPGIYVPGHQAHDGPHWKLRIQQAECGDDCRREWHEVDETTYHAHDIGDWWAKERRAQ